MNKIPKYSLILIMPIISYSAEYYSHQIIKKGNFNVDNFFASGNNSVYKKRNYYTLAILNQALIISLYSLIQFTTKKNSRKNKN